MSQRRISPVRLTASQMKPSSQRQRIQSSSSKNPEGRGPHIHERGHGRFSSYNYASAGWTIKRTSEPQGMNAQTLASYWMTSFMTSGHRQVFPEDYDDSIEIEHEECGTDLITLTRQGGQRPEDTSGVRDHNTSRRVCEGWQGLESSLETGSPRKSHAYKTRDTNTRTTRKRISHNSKRGRRR